MEVRHQTMERILQKIRSPSHFCGLIMNITAMEI